MGRSNFSTGTETEKESITVPTNLEKLEVSKEVKRETVVDGVVQETTVKEFVDIQAKGIILGNYKLEVENDQLTVKRIDESSDIIFKANKLSVGNNFNISENTSNNFTISDKEGKEVFALVTE